MFHFTEWTDLSDEIGSLFFLEMMSAIRLKVFEKIIFSNSAFLEYQEQKASFIRRNFLDAKYDFKEKRQIPGLLNNIGVYTGEMPCFFNRYLMIFLDLIMFGWVQRLVMLVNTGKTYFTVRKYIED